MWSTNLIDMDHKALLIGDHAGFRLTSHANRLYAYWAMTVTAALISYVVGYGLVMISYQLHMRNHYPLFMDSTFAWLFQHILTAALARRERP